ncbi:MAG: hypothetical protein ACRD36_09130, partial [Candidatus Acidiferrum sp.]
MATKDFSAHLDRVRRFTAAQAEYNTNDESRVLGKISFGPFQGGFTMQISTAFHPTHEVQNQTPALVDCNLFTADKALSEALTREGAAWAEEQVGAFGGLMGSPEVS